MKKEYFEILLEAMDSKFQLTMEAFSSLDAKIDRVRDELIDKIEVVDCKVMGLAVRVERLEEKVDSVHAELVEHRENVELHKTSRRSALKKVAG